MFYLNIFRYRGSTDDLRRSREDISIPSFIPKLLSPRNKEEKLKRQDSKDDIRHIFGTNRRQKEETKPSTGQTFVRDDVKTGIRFFRRESKEDVGRESATTITNSCLTKERPLNKEESQEWTDECVGETTSRSKFNSAEFNSTSDSKECTESECIVRGDPKEEEIEDIEKVEETEVIEDQREDSEEEVFAKMANELTQDHLDEPNLQKSGEKYEGIKNNEKEEVENEGKFRGRKDLGEKEQQEKGEDTPDFKNLRDTVEAVICGNNYGDVPLVGDKRITEGSSPGKKTDDFQVVSLFSKIWVVFIESLHDDNIDFFSRFEESFLRRNFRIRTIQMRFQTGVARV